MSNGVLVETAPATAVAASIRIKPKVSRDDVVMRFSMVLIGLFLVVCGAPAAIRDDVEEHARQGRSLRRPCQLCGLLLNTGVVPVHLQQHHGVGAGHGHRDRLLDLSTAYALTRTCMPFKGFFKAVALIPILAPSLLPAISLIYLFGNQGDRQGTADG